MAKIYCSNCGQLVNEDSNYCWNCGAAQHGPESAVYRAQAVPLEHPTVPSTEAEKPRDPKLQKLLSETILKRHLAHGAIWLFFFNYVSTTALVIPLFAIGIYVQPLVAVLFLAYLLMNYLIASLVHNSFFFAIKDDALEVEYGILNKRHVTVPFRQVQNVNIIRTFVDRFLGIARLEIESAGSSSLRKRYVVGGTKSKAEGFLPGVSMKDAQHLHDLILQKALHHRR